MSSHRATSKRHVALPSRGGGRKRTAPAVSLTHRQMDAMRFIQGHIDVLGYAPSFDEICAGINASSRSVVFRLLNALAERGFIRRQRHRSRSVKILRRVSVPKINGTPLQVIYTHNPINTE